VPLSWQSLSHRSGMLRHQVCPEVHLPQVSRQLLKRVQKAKHILQTLNKEIWEILSLLTSASVACVINILRSQLMLLVSKVSDAVNCSVT
jgi:hypothetical protein